MNMCNYIIVLQKDENAQYVSTLLSNDALLSKVKNSCALLFASASQQKCINKQARENKADEQI